MADDDVLRRIRMFVDEEDELRRSKVADPERLAHLETALDQCWDLLRQRRAQREFGGDPTAASVRSEETVEHYEQ